MSSCLMCGGSCCSSDLEPEELLPFGLMGIDLKAPPKEKSKMKKTNNEQLLLIEAN